MDQSGEHNRTAPEGTGSSDTPTFEGEGSSDVGTRPEAPEEAEDPRFAFLTVPFFTKAAVFPGSVGCFRYRFQRFSWPGKDDARIQAWVYENVSFELARDVETAEFPWTEEGAAALRRWLSVKARERGTEPYRVPFPRKSIPDDEKSIPDDETTNGTTK